MVLYLTYIIPTLPHMLKYKNILDFKLRYEPKIKDVHQILLYSISKMSSTVNFSFIISNKLFLPCMLCFTYIFSSDNAKDIDVYTLKDLCVRYIKYNSITLNDIINYINLCDYNIIHRRTV